MQEDATMAKTPARFIVIHKEGSTIKEEGLRQLLVDKETGVTYLLWKSGYGSSITPLLNADGTPVITKL